MSWGGTAHGARRVAAACDRRASGAGGGQGHPELGFSKKHFEAARGGLWKEDSLPRAIGVGVRHHLLQTRARHSGSGAPPHPLGLGFVPSPGVSAASPGFSLAGPRSPRWCRVTARASSQPGSQEGPTLPPGRPRPRRAVPTAAPLQRPRPEPVVQGMSTRPRSPLD